MFKRLAILLCAVAAFGLAADDGLAAKKRKKNANSATTEMSAEQRKANHRAALALCRKKYGPIVRAEINYVTKMVTCYPQ